MSNLDNCCCKSETLAMATVPMQEWCEPYDFETALENGTIFPCLNLEFYKATDIPKHCCCGETSEQEKMLLDISTVGFALNDLTLYLDTHPTCEKGLSLFKELLQKKLDMLAEYAKKFNPLTQISMITGTPETNMYGWAEGPMPWEGGLI